MKKPKELTADQQIEIQILEAENAIAIQRMILNCLRKIQFLRKEAKK